MKERLRQSRQDNNRSNLPFTFAWAVIFASARASAELSLFVCGEEVKADLHYMTMLLWPQKHRSIALYQNCYYDETNYWRAAVNSSTPPLSLSLSLFLSLSLLKKYTWDCILKRFALSPRLFPKATEIISKVLKTVSPFSRVEILLICHLSSKNILNNSCSFGERLVK